MSWLADTILVIHALFVAFVVGGLAFVWIGAWCGWQAVRSFSFRIAHLAAIIFVAAESWVGVTCPLTAWEDRLRGAAPNAGFVARWLHQVLYYDFPGWVFALIYAIFALVVAITFALVPPRRERRAE